jgi:hypothetical protein
MSDLTEKLHEYLASQIKIYTGYQHIGTHALQHTAVHYLLALQDIILKLQELEKEENG